jgi:hypothetical protein
MPTFRSIQIMMGVLMVWVLVIRALIWYDSNTPISPQYLQDYNSQGHGSTHYPTNTRTGSK